jgi:hypothetical protein
VAKSKRIPLVSQYMENVSSVALEDYQDLFRGFAKRRHGVYALYKGKRLYYVGLAKNLRTRLKQHLRDRHGKAWDRFSMYLTLNDSHIKELESLVLRIVRPDGNRQMGKFGRAENLQRRFARIVRDDARDRLDDLLGRVRKPKARSVGRTLKRSTPVLAEYVTSSMRLRGRHKGKVVKARVLRNGIVSVGGVRFNSPSLAAKAACPGRGAVNGWHFWTFERGPGDWVRLNELRR